MPAPSTKPALTQRLLLGLLMALLVLPALQAKWPLVPVEPLKGYSDDVPTAHVSWSGLWTNSFQPQLENYLNANLGFRPWLVRLRNQVAYSAWDKLLTPMLGLGPDQNIYQQGPANAYLGRDFIGEAAIAVYTRHLRRVQDTLRAHGTQLLFVLAPSKSRLAPQSLADTSATQAQGPTNYDVIRTQFDKAGINTLDATALLLRWRDAGAPYPMFPRTGTHWSGYAVARVGDTLFSRLQSMTGRNLPTITEAGPPTVATRTTDLRYTDNDLGDLANLLRPIPPYPMAYPQVVFGPEKGRQRLNALIIGDSFAQSFYGFYPYYQHLLTADSRYWSYNQYILWPETASESHRVAELNLAQQLRGRDVVLLIASEGNIHNLGFGFIDQAFEMFCPITQADEPRIAELIQGMRSSPEWLGKLTTEADSKGQPLEKYLRGNAVYLRNQER